MLPTVVRSYIKCPTVSIYVYVAISEIEIRTKSLFYLQTIISSRLLSPICVIIYHERGKEKHIDNETDS